MGNFKQLDVWQQSCRLSVELYLAMKDCKDFGFKDQITRSGLSIPSNIAEGVTRISDKESLQFLSIAKGSAAELETQIYIGCEIGYLNKGQMSSWLTKLQNIQAMLSGLIKRYKAQVGRNS